MSPHGVFMFLVDAQLQTQSLSVFKAKLLNRSFGDLQPELSRNELQTGLFSDMFTEHCLIRLSINYSTNLMTEEEGY